MATRRRRTQVSSLDLFLDTICNAFGGIMFISILVSILIQMRGNEPEAQAASNGLSESEAIERQDQMHQLQRDVEILAQTNADRERLLFNEETSEARALIDQKEKLAGELERIQKMQESLLGSTASKGQDIERKKQELMDLAQKLSDARLAVSERSKELEESLDSVETTTTLPKVSSTFKGNLMFAMRYGKLYLLSDITGSARNDVNSEHATAIELGGGVQVRLKKDAGWNLRSQSDLAQIEAVLRGHSSSSTFVSVAVFSDSHAEFLEWKSKLVQMQYDYDLLPLDNPDTLMIVSGGTATVQ